MSGVTGVWEGGSVAPLPTCLAPQVHPHFPRAAQTQPEGRRRPAQQAASGGAWGGGRRSRDKSQRPHVCDETLPWGRTHNASAGIWGDTAINWNRTRVGLRGQGLGAEFTPELRLRLTCFPRSTGLAHLALCRISVLFSDRASWLQCWLALES